MTEEKIDELIRSIENHAVEMQLDQIHFIRSKKIWHLTETIYFELLIKPESFIKLQKSGWGSNQVHGPFTFSSVVEFETNQTIYFKYS